MAPEKEVNNGVEWRIKVADGSSQTLVPEAKPAACSNFLFGDLKLFIVGLAFKVCKFSQKAWDLGVEDPRKVIHCLKVGMALTVVSIFYYTRPLYEGVGGNAMWAILTVVVVFENTVGKYSQPLKESPTHRDICNGSYSIYSSFDTVERAHFLCLSNFFHFKTLKFRK